jgi:4-amino-4-deoxy-L-arabinose transferase-like glycosyltransferase
MDYINALLELIIGSVVGFIMVAIIATILYYVLQYFGFKIKKPSWKTLLFIIAGIEIIQIIQIILRGQGVTPQEVRNINIMISIVLCCVLIIILLYQHVTKQRQQR